jgi:hypothetical protein
MQNGLDLIEHLVKIFFLETNLPRSAKHVFHVTCIAIFYVKIAIFHGMQGRRTNF